MVHVLTADLGNSALKLRLFRCTEGARCVSAELVAGVELARGAPDEPDDGAGDRERIRAWLREHPRPARGALSSVAGDRASRAVAAALAEPGPVENGERVELCVAPPCGLRILCREPERVGRDRLYAGRAALALARGPAIVVDCGTALTVDAVDLGAGSGLGGARDDAGVFHGGAIAPGPALLARALGEGAAQLFTLEPRAARADAADLATRPWAVPALGRDTAEALASGVVHGLRGAAERLVREVAREAGFAQPVVVATGGAALLLLAADAAGASAAPIGAFAHALHVPDLVHHGLLLALGIEPPRPSPGASGRVTDEGSACAN